MKNIFRSLFAACILIGTMLACSALPIPFIQQSTEKSQSTAIPVTQNAPTKSSVTLPPLPEGMPTVETDENKMMAVLQSGKFGFFDQFSVEKYQDSDFAKPGTVNYTVTIPSTQPIFFNYGWCAKDNDILKQNLQHIDVSAFFNDQQIPDEYLSALDSTADNGWTCATKGMLLSNWKAGKYKLKLIITFDEKINDGGSDYEAGDYIMIYDVTVK